MKQEDLVAVLREIGARLALQNWLLEQLWAMGLRNAPDPIAAVEATAARAAEDIALDLVETGSGADVQARTAELAAEFWQAVRSRIQIDRAANGEAAPSSDLVQ